MPLTLLDCSRKVALAAVASFVLFAPPTQNQALADGAAAGGTLLRVPDDYPTIGDALAASTPGDIVGVRAGTYVGSFVPRNGVSVLGGYDPNFTVRDPEVFVTTLVSTGRIVICQSCGGPTALVDGFTMTGGGGEVGGLVYIEGASPTLSGNRFIDANGGRGGSIHLFNSSSRLSGNVFTGSRSSEVGGAITVFSSMGAFISNCRFENNNAVSSGGAIFLNDSFNITIEDCVFLENQSPFHGGAMLLQNSNALVDGCLFFRNTGDQGGAIGCFTNFNPTFTSCTIADNTGTTGGGFYVHPEGGGTITRSIVANNTGSGLVADSGAIVTNSCNDVWNNSPSDYVNVTPGPNSISADPLFCDLDAGDLRISPASPCAPAQSPTCGLIGALPPACVQLFIRVPDDQSSIVSALNVAEPGDTVAVAEGRYVERVTLKDRVLLLGGWRNDFAARDPVAYPTVIDAGGFLSAVVAQNGEEPATVIDGFVITGGDRPGGFGGGMYCFNSSPTISNNVFSGNKAGQGAAIACRSGAEPVITGNLFLENEAFDPPGGAIYVETSPRIERNTFDSNRGPLASGVAALFGAQPVITRNIVVNGRQGAGLFADKGGAPLASCNDVWQNEGGDYFGMLPGPNSLSLDPLFCPDGEVLHAYFLQQNSPCAPPQSPVPCGLIGARGVACASAGMSGSAAPPFADWLGLGTPNPAGFDGAVFGFGLGKPARVRLVIRDLAGRHVRTLIDEMRPAGDYRMQWDGRGRRGEAVSSGIYFYRLTADGRRVGEEKLVVLR